VSYSPSGATGARLHTGNGAYSPSVGTGVRLHTGTMAYSPSAGTGARLYSTIAPALIHQVLAPVPNYTLAPWHYGATAFLALWCHKWFPPLLPTMACE